MIKKRFSLILLEFFCCITVTETLLGHFGFFEACLIVSTCTGIWENSSKIKCERIEEWTLRCDL